MAHPGPVFSRVALQLAMRQTAD
ncbi:hypothetical protein KL86DES1_20906 [uncultured Desulfovibrio sp.]|uniref:Uncharacterized protein n=1 Tax=uncultured Desulfovibrio sp. TaxID=167968 RepID=A0A212L6D1_9BACT|nr:hypothetical protein KL86DES1_20906 [uncultured Desulfovibrio sp.]VZH33812.1 conserved protein of unknown function [Desulfovibrio sp. 86]